MTYTIPYSGNEYKNTRLTITASSTNSYRKNYLKFFHERKFIPLIVGFFIIDL